MGSISVLELPQKEDITFVVCGKILTNGKFRTIDCLASIRKFFPESKIVLSTWLKEPVERLASYCDEVAISNPASCPIKYNSVLDQNRPNTADVQQVTGQAGMALVRTPWAVKTRTDFLFTGDAFFHFYRQWEPILTWYDKQYRIFKRRVLAPWLFTKDPSNTCVAYQLSDFFQFGTTEDLKLLWDGHRELEEVMNYFAEHPNSPYSNPDKYNHLYNVEQCFFMNAVQKRISVRMPEWYCDPKVKEYLPEIECVYASNVLLATLFELQIRTRWEEEEPIFPEGMLISFQTLLQWYLRWCDSPDEVCQSYLKEHPVPLTAKRRLGRKLRMRLREYRRLREIYRFCRKWTYVICDKFRTG